MRLRAVKQFASDNKWQYLAPNIFIRSIGLIFFLSFFFFVQLCQGQNFYVNYLC